MASYHKPIGQEIDSIPSGVQVAIWFRLRAPVSGGLNTVSAKYSVFQYWTPWPQVRDTSCEQGHSPASIPHLPEATVSNS